MQYCLENCSVRLSGEGKAGVVDPRTGIDPDDDKLAAQLGSIK
jgi:hypothetical protein